MDVGTMEATSGAGTAVTRGGERSSATFACLCLDERGVSHAIRKTVRALRGAVSSVEGAALEASFVVGKKLAFNIRQFRSETPVSEQQLWRR